MKIIGVSVIGCSRLRGDFLETKESCSASGTPSSLDAVRAGVQRCRRRG